ncbi:22922_t:CDS:2, partial [Racocetra persica]
HRKCLADFPNMPLPTILPMSEHPNHLITKEQNYSIEELTQIVENRISSLNTDQRCIFKKITTAHTDFARWLLKLGEGRIPTIEPENHTIQLPDKIILSSSDLNNLIPFVYSEFSLSTVSHHLVEYALLAPKNNQ